MNNNKFLKNKIRNREFVVGGWVSYCDPGIAETFAKAGFDFVAIDMEHTVISLEAARAIITACHASGSACLPRPVSHNNDVMKPLLEAGADGLFLPMVNSRNQIDGITRDFYYTPLGNRSYGVNRAHGYGLTFQSYISEWNETGICLAQVESIAGVEAIDEIVRNPLLDGVMIGPYDLSGSLGVPGDVNSKVVLDACDRVINACEKAGIGCCTQIQSPSSKNIKSALDQGYTFLILGSDLFVITEWSKAVVELTAEYKST